MPELEMNTEGPPRYVVGIDLGTTNSAVAFVDTHDKNWAVRDFKITQVVGANETEARDVLPSFHYEAAASEFPAGALDVPWRPGASAVVGYFAREHGAAVPGRLVVSAKSWLSHSGVDRSADLLPWHAAEGATKLSPVEASRRYLEHMRMAWDHAHPEHPLEAQDVILTVPASFDEVARELTVAAARGAGMKRVTLLEEPQAAFYAWINRETTGNGGAAGEQAAWEKKVRAGQKILVCDVGGGTTDFSLIRVREGSGFRVQGSGQKLEARSEKLEGPSSVVRGPLSVEGDPLLSTDNGQRTTDKQLTIDHGPLTPARNLSFIRVAVGEHLILGGDNLDLALAHHIEKKIKGEGKLEARQWGPLVRTCRALKETLLGENPPEKLTVNASAGGSKLIGGAIRVEITRAEVEQVLVEGFLPRASLIDKPAARRSGFGEFGLPYAPDAGITRYLAAFLSAHRFAGEGSGFGVQGSGQTKDESGRACPELAEGMKDENATDNGPLTTDKQLAIDHGQLTPTRNSGGHGDPARPDLVLFNGGLFESPILRARLVDVIGDWFSDAGEPWRPIVLENDRLDLAVARGAAYYGMVRRGQGVRISGGLARSYYIGVDENINHKDIKGGEHCDTESRDSASEPPTTRSRAISILPAGTEEGHEVTGPDRTFDLLIRQPVEFGIYFSSLRTTDPAGAIVEIDPEQLRELPPIRTVLQSGRKSAADTVKVNLHARLTEIGTLELWLAEVAGDRQWKLQFDIRATQRSDFSAHQSAAESEGIVDQSIASACAGLIRSTFTKNSPNRPEGLIKRLETAAGIGRSDWPSSLMRALWEVMLEVEAARKLSDQHEARWLNLAGFCLRPGYGLAVDDWRIAQMWKLYPGRVIHARNELVRAEWWILWRRLAGGLAAGQQQTLAQPILGALRDRIRMPGSGGRNREPAYQFLPHETAEVWRCLGAMELLSQEVKAELATLLLDLLSRDRPGQIHEAALWAIGRIGARVPIYGPLNALMPAEAVESCLLRLMELKHNHPTAQFAAVQLARKTGDRYRDLSEPTRAATLQWLAAHAAPPHYVELVRAGGNLAEEEQKAAFGEVLPKGLRIE